MFEDTVPGPKTSEALDHRVGADFALISNLYIIFDNGIGPYSDVLANSVTGSDDRSGVYLHKRCTVYHNNALECAGLPALYYMTTYATPVFRRAVA